MEPWKSQDNRELAGVFSHAIEGLRKSAILLSPIIPSSSQQMLAGLGYASPPTWTDVQHDLTIEGMQTVLDSVKQHGAGKPVFPYLKTVQEALPGSAP